VLQMSAAEAWHCRRTVVRAADVSSWSLTLQTNCCSCRCQQLKP